MPNSSPKFSLILVLVAWMGWEVVLQHNHGLQASPLLDDLNVALEDAIEDELEDELEHEIEDIIEDELEDEIEDAIENELEDEIEDSIEDELEDEIEDAIEDELEDEIEDAIEDELEDEIEDAIEDELEDEIEDSIEDELEDELDDELETLIDDELEDEYKEAIEDELEDELEDEIEEVEDEIEEDFEAPIDEEFEDDIELSAEEEASDIEDGPDAGFDDVSGRASETIEAIEDEVELELDLFIDEQGRLALTDDWIILAPADSMIALEREGYLIQRTDELTSLGYVIGTIEAPSSFNPGDTSVIGLEVLNSADIAVARNEIYRPTSSPTTSPRGDELTQPATLNITTQSQAIGMIDSSISLEHEVFAKAEIIEESFQAEGYAVAEHHGTAVASLLVGNSASYRGYAAGARLFNGAVFSRDANRAEFSSVVGIARAVNWLLSQEVRLINMSLAGPDNIILRRVIEKACGTDAIIVAAVGNDGALATPRFPAAYNCTIGVTAVDVEDQPFYRAGRGSHVDFAAPGVHIPHANPSGYSRSTGTSFATPYVTALISQLDSSQDSFKQLRKRAIDIGPEGKDTIFGYGVLKPTTHTSE